MFLPQEALRRVPENQFLLDPVKNMKIKDEAFLDVMSKLDKFKARMNSHKLHTDPARDRLCEAFAKKMEVSWNGCITLIFKDVGNLFWLIFLDRARFCVLENTCFIVISKKGGGYLKGMYYFCPWKCRKIILTLSFLGLSSILCTSKYIFHSSQF